MDSDKINPQVLGSVLINGVYYDKKTAKFYSLQDNKPMPYVECKNKEENIENNFYNMCRIF